VSAVGLVALFAVVTGVNVKINHNGTAVANILQKNKPQPVLQPFKQCEKDEPVPRQFTNLKENKNLICRKKES
jgi:hypothetical protein